MTVAYQTDLAAWALEQARLIRAGVLSQLDLENIADEIESVGKTEKRELTSRMAVLIAHLLKWRYQPKRRGRSWQLTIAIQRTEAADVLKDSPSLKNKFSDLEWVELVWMKAVSQAVKETRLPFSTFPAECPWTFDQIMDAKFWPD